MLAPQILSSGVAEEHKSEEILALNPRGQVPTLVDKDIVVCESLAAILYLEDAYPEHKLLPSGKKERAQVRSPAIILLYPVCLDTPMQVLPAVELCLGVA